MKFPLTVKPFGEHAILIEWPDEVEETILHDILSFQDYLEQLDFGAIEMVPAYNSLALVSNDGKMDFEVMSSKIPSWYAKKPKKRKKTYTLWTIPVCYDLDFGIDLDDIAKNLDLGIEELIGMHTSNEYTVYGIGFLPGFMYLGGVPENLQINRRKQPRAKVPKGAVGLAGKQTGIYPQESPGGWNIIGNSPVAMFKSERENPCFVNTGDKIKFESISRAAYDLIKIQVEVGVHQLQKEIRNA